jgi:transposase-like protein
LVRQWQEARGLADGGYTAVCTQLGRHRETLRRWVIEADVEDGARPGLPLGERDRFPPVEFEQTWRENPQIDGEVRQ